MSKHRDYRDTIVDINHAIEDISCFIQGVDFAGFEKNKEKSYATVYCLLIVSEAVKNLPAGVTAKYPEIPWRLIAKMRDRLIHGYFVVDFERVWETVLKDLPPLHQVIKKILIDEEITNK